VLHASPLKHLIRFERGELGSEASDRAIGSNYFRTP
jgi:hypothetical protein